LSRDVSIKRSSKSCRRSSIGPLNFGRRPYFMFSLDLDEEIASRVVRWT